MSTALSVRNAASQFCQWLWANNRSPKTIGAYSSDLEQFAVLVGDVPIHELNRSVLESWLLQLQTNGYLAASIRRKAATIRQYFRYLVECGSLHIAPTHGFTLRLGEERRLTRVVDREVLSAFLDWFERRALRPRMSRAQNFVAIRDRAIVRLLCSTGIRVGELVSLQEADVLERDEALSILGKGRRERLAFLVDRIDRDYLRSYLNIRSDFATTPKLFVKLNGQALSDEGIRRLLRNAGRGAGTKNRITPHMLRHTAATRMLENGADLRVVQVFLGHASIRSTERYTHVSQAHLKAVLARCHPLRLAA